MGPDLKSILARLRKTPSRKWIFPVLLLTAFLLRFPFFFRDYIDPDDSTFILMGQAWVDGYLPYTRLWDIKPPLTFLFFAGLIYVFGKSFIAIRLAGTLVVALIGWTTYDLTARLSNTSTGYAAGIICVMLCSLFGSIQGVMSEHLLMGVFMGSLCLILREDSLPRRLMAGFLLGAALMIKISIAYSILLIGLWLIYDAFRGYTPGRAMGRLLSLGLPALAVILATLAPYALSGQTEIWWDSVIRAPLGYTQGSGRSPFSAWGVGLTTLGVLFWAFRYRKLDLKQRETLILFLAIVGVLWTFIQSGRINTHYLIQLYPPLVVLLAAAFGPGLTPGISRYRWVLPVILLLLPVESYREYVHILKYRQERGTFFNGEGFSVPAYLRESEFETENILFARYHIGYWVLDRYPPVKAATHPSNLCKEEMFPYYNAPRLTSMQELRHLMEEVKPNLVVTRFQRRYFDEEKIRENAYMDSIVAARYHLLDTVDQAAIYLREEP